MSKLLDISIHGTQRVAIVERLVHVCRYEPGLVLLEGEAGKSPVNFLRDMANLLRDELDFALLDGSCSEVSEVTSELVRQWFIYQAADDSQSDAQSVHHYLDIGLQSGRLALIVIERSVLLADAAINLLVGLMARHSHLTVLFAGVVDARPLLRRAQQAEVPIHRIDLPDVVAPLADAGSVYKTGANLSSSQFDHKFSDDSYGLPEIDEEEELLFASTNISGDDRRRREPRVSSRYEATQSSLRIHASDSMLGVGRRLSEARAWGATTLAVIQKKKGGGLLLLSGCVVLVALIALMLVNAKSSGVDTNTGPTLAQKTSPEILPEVFEQPHPSVNVPASTPASSAAVVKSPVPVSAIPPVPSGALEQAVVQAEKSQAAPSVATNKVQQATPVAKAAEPKRESRLKAVAMTEKQWRAHPNNYTVQIAAAHSEVNIKKLAAALPTSTPHFVRHTTRDGKPWFVLVFGSFASKREASAAREVLPAAIKAGSMPWVRKQGEIFDH